MPTKLSNSGIAQFDYSVEILNGGTGQSLTSGVITTLSALSGEIFGNRQSLHSSDVCLATSAVAAKVQTSGSRSH
jgi:hypothetical protein